MTPDFIAVTIGAALALVGFLTAGAWYRLGFKRGEHVATLRHIAKLDEHAKAMRKLYEDNRQTFTGARRAN
jgi:hypothetical protein